MDLHSHLPSPTEKTQNFGKRKHLSKLLLHVSSTGWLSTSINLSSSETSIFRNQSLNNSCIYSLTQIKQLKNMDSSQNASYQAGQAKGQTQEKGNQMMNKASNTAQSCKENVQEAGQQAKAKAQGAADAVKNATGMNK